MLISPSLKLLALETSTPWCSVALWLDGQVLHQEALAEQSHSELLLPMVDALLREAGITARALDAVAFGSGPGAFTGVRIACGVAQGLAMGAGAKVVPICTLLALAEASSHDQVVSCLDARMGELYVAAYRKQQSRWVESVAPTLCKPENCPALEGDGWHGVGSGFALHAPLIASRYGAALHSQDGTLHPHAREVALLACSAFAAGEAVSPAQAAPLYVRDRVALTSAQRARGERL